MSQHEDERKKPKKPKRDVWYRRPDFLLGLIIGALLLLAASWFVNNPNSPGFWRSFR